MNIPIEIVVLFVMLFVAGVGGAFGISVSLVKRLFTGLEGKITGFCEQNTKDHQDMWRVLHTHGHTCCDEKNPKVYTVE